MNMLMSEPQFGQLVAPGGKRCPQLEHSRTRFPAFVSCIWRFMRTRHTMIAMMATTTTTPAISQIALFAVTP